MYCMVLVLPLVANSQPDSVFPISLDINLAIDGYLVGVVLHLGLKTCIMIELPMMHYERF